MGGYLEGLRRRAEVLVVIAGDLQHDPAEMPRPVEVIEMKQADYVTGERLSNNPVAQGMPPFAHFSDDDLCSDRRLKQLWERSMRRTRSPHTDRRAVNLEVGSVRVGCDPLLHCRFSMTNHLSMLFAMALLVRNFLVPCFQTVLALFEDFQRNPMLRIDNSTRPQNEVHFGVG